MPANRAVKLRVAEGCDERAFCRCSERFGGQTNLRKGDRKAAFPQGFFETFAEAGWHRGAPAQNQRNGLGQIGQLARLLERDRKPATRDWIMSS